MTPKTGSGYAKSIDVADVSKKRDEAEPPITVETEHVHEAVDGQKDAD